MATGRTVPSRAGAPSPPSVGERLHGCRLLVNENGSPCEWFACVEVRDPATPCAFNPVICVAATDNSDAGVGVASTYSFGRSGAVPNCRTRERNDDGDAAPLRRRCARRVRPPERNPDQAEAGPREHGGDLGAACHRPRTPPTPWQRRDDRGQQHRSSSASILALQNSR